MYTRRATSVATRESVGFGAQPFRRAHVAAKVGFWDAMIVLAAAESGCDVLWTEDLNDGQELRGVQIRNPFTAA